jgi:hypothetical protein
MRVAKEAFFSANETPDGVQFDIVPASMPASFGCLMVFLYVMAAIGGFVALSGMAAGEDGGGAFWGGAFIGAIAGGGILMFKRLNARYARVPVRMVVTGQGITIGERLYRRDDIRELIVGLPFDKGGAEMVQYHSGVAATAGAATGMEIRNRSYALMARLKSSSKNEILAFGLTLNMARSLQSDVTAALSGNY